VFYRHFKGCVRLRPRHGWAPLRSGRPSCIPFGVARGRNPPAIVGRRSAGRRVAGRRATSRAAADHAARTHALHPLALFRSVSTARRINALLPLLRPGALVGERRDARPVLRPLLADGRQRAGRRRPHSYGDRQNGDSPASHLANMVPSAVARCNGRVTTGTYFGMNCTRGSGPEAGKADGLLFAEGLQRSSRSRSPLHRTPPRQSDAVRSQ
jgi:hypothetical protein